MPGRGVAGNSEGWGVRLGLNHTGPERWGPFNELLGWLLSVQAKFGPGRREGCWGRSSPWASRLRLPLLSS